MGIWPMPVRHNLPVIPSWSADAGHGPLTPTLVGAASSTLTANAAYVYPFHVFEPVTAVKMTYIVGSAATGNVDLGIYDGQLNRLVSSGSTAQGSTNTIQELDITDTLLLPGEYLMAIQASSSSGSAFVMAAGTDEGSLPSTPNYAQAVGSFGLPTTLNPDLFAISAVPIFVVMAVHFHSTV